jgi:outer membrane protein assembly factor BamB
MNNLSGKVLFCTVFLILANICLAEMLHDKPKLLWTYRLGSKAEGTPAVNSNIIFTATVDGQITALSHDGKQEWSRKIKDASFDAPPLLAGAHIVVGSSKGIVYGFKTKDGTTAWTYRTDDTIQGKAAWPEPNRVAVIGQSAGSIHYIDLLTGKPVWIVEETNRCDGSPTAENGMLIFGNCDAAIHVFDIKTGDKIRSIDLGAEGQVAGGVAINGSYVITGTQGGNIVCADINTGKTKWTFEDTDSAIYTTPAIESNNVVIAADSGTIYCLETSTGKMRWKASTDGTPSSPLLVDSRIIVSSDGVLHIFSLDSGKKLWSYEVGDEITSPAVARNMIIVIGDDGTVSAFGAK